MVKQATSVARTSELSDIVLSDFGPDVLPMDVISGDCPINCDLDKTSKHSGINANKGPPYEGRTNGIGEEEQNIEVCEFLHPILSDVEHNAAKDLVMVSNSAHVSLAKVRDDILYEFDDVLDDVVLGERRKMLLSSIDAAKGAQMVKKSISVLLQKNSELSDIKVSDSGRNLLPLDVVSCVCQAKCDLERTPKLSGIYANEEPREEARVNEFDKEHQNSAVCDILHQTSTEDDHSSSKESLEVSTSVHGQSMARDDTLYKFDEVLDNIALGERRRMLASRKLMNSSGSHVATLPQTECEGLFKSSPCMIQNAGIEKHKIDFFQKNITAEDTNSLSNVYDQQDPENGFDRANHESCSLILPTLGDINTLKMRASPPSAKFMPFGTQEIPTGAEAMTSSVILSHAHVKDEPVDNVSLSSEGKTLANFSVGSEMLTVKNESVFSNYFKDELDHLPLIDRVELLSSGSHDVSMSHRVEAFKEDVDVNPDIIESVKPINLIRLRKRKRTATNSLETALEEDAPGLLKVLTERGVSVEEIKLYGEEESDDDLDESVTEDSFSDLEAVISQLFSQRQSFLKFPLLHSKCAKINYCLSCLLSLVEQTRFLRNRKWPVEWGWCRDLQSFIFVFQRHNRIVLERPEYGYATYFFELVKSVPVAWQIKRLITAMKLTSCGRITLIENKPLMVGEDLSEGEARILTEFGWTRNTGLGTMLNYCDRVVHDRKQDMDSFEWRSKIGRQLMNGFNGGYIVSQNIPKKLIECQGSEDVQVKIEY